MLSRPFTAPSPHGSGLPAAGIFRHNWDGASIAEEYETVPLADPDPETNNLLPRRQRRHRVRIQGRLAIVRTVSVTNLRQTKNGSPIAQADSHCEDVRTSPIGLRGSYDGSEVDEDGGFVAERDAQLRGYGIGGAGNIRRPTDIIGASSSASPSLLSLIHTPSSPPTMPLNSRKPDKWRWRMASLLNGVKGSVGRYKATAGG
ncbi:hypothetical protein GGR51DRAFT_522105 [Nemania sp. FL0031]|nr:hypothetical protein GGR51DRAFT_522105 [Nemania sp. FL0031]